MSPTAQKTFTFVLPGNLKDGLQAVRARDGIAEAEQIRRGVQMWLESKGVRVKTASRRVSPRRKA
jgi:hypothetical protein